METVKHWLLLKVFSHIYKYGNVNMLTNYTFQILEGGKSLTSVNSGSQNTVPVTETIWKWLAMICPELFVLLFCWIRVLYSAMYYGNFNCNFST